jgi:hypothetical protein
MERTQAEPDAYMRQAISNGHISLKEDPPLARKLRPLLLEFCKSIVPNTPESSGSGQQDLTDDEIDEIVRLHLKEMKKRLGIVTQGCNWRSEPPTMQPEPANQLFLNAPKPQPTPSAIENWASKPGADSLKTQSQKALMGSIRESLVGAKAVAAFCCGGSVAFRGSEMERHPKRLAEVAPVTIRWDDKHGWPASMIFSETSSENPDFHTALEKLCQASEPASFGRGGETVFDSKLSLHSCRDRVRMTLVTG